MHQCAKFILFWNDTLHVSDGLSVHHQEFTTVHTPIGICQTDTAVCLLASRQQYLFDLGYAYCCVYSLELLIRQQYLFDLGYAYCCVYSLELLMMDGKTVRNM